MALALRTAGLQCQNGDYDSACGTSGRSDTRVKPRPKNASFPDEQGVRIFELRCESLDGALRRKRAASRCDVGDDANCSVGVVAQVPDALRIDGERDGPEVLEAGKWIEVKIVGEIRGAQTG